MGNYPISDVRLSEFSQYVNATPSGKAALVSSIVAQAGTQYDPATDWARRLRHAIVAGRRQQNDRAAIKAAVDSAPPNKRAGYARLANGWLRVLPEFVDTTTLTASRAYWSVPDVPLGVKVSPELVLAHPDERVEVIKLHLSTTRPLRPETAQAQLRVMEHVSSRWPGNARPVVVDVHEGKVYRPTPHDSGYDLLLESDLSALAYWLHRQTDAAA